MTDVLVCIKRVPDATGAVTLTADGGSVDGRHAGFTVSNHESCAIELAVQIAGATGGTATVLTLGAAEAAEQLRAALAIGATAATHIEADPAVFGPADVAREIAAVVRAHAGEGRAHDLILLGNDATDSGDFQVGIRLGYELDRPVVNGVATASVDGDVVTARGEGPEGHETYRVPLPAVVTILEGGVEPRYPSVPGRMKARKVTIEQRHPSGNPLGANRVRLLLPPPEPSEVQILGAGRSAASAVVDLLESLGVSR